MKKIFAFFLILILAFSLCACEKITEFGQNLKAEVTQMVQSGEVKNVFDDLGQTVEKIADEVKVHVDSSVSAVRDEVVSHFPEEDANYTHAASAEVPADGIREIEISWISGNIHVETYSGSVIRFSESSKAMLSGEQQMRYEVEKDGDLKILCCAKRLFNGTIPDKTLTVRIPSSLRLEELKIGCVGADTEILNLTADKIKIESVSGKLQTRNTVSDKFEFETVSGNAVLDGITVKEEMDLESVSADIDMKLSPDFTGFTLKKEGIDAEFMSDLPLTSSEKTQVYGDGSVELEFESISGSLHIA